MCSWGNPEHFPESAEFSLYGPRRKTLFQRRMYSSQKGITKTFQSRMNFGFQKNKVMPTRWQQRQECVMDSNKGSAKVKAIKSIKLLLKSLKKEMIKSYHLPTTLQNQK